MMPNIASTPAPNPSHSSTSRPESHGACSCETTQALLRDIVLTLATRQPNTQVCRCSADHTHDGRSSYVPSTSEQHAMFKNTDYIAKPIHPADTRDVSHRPEQPQAMHPTMHAEPPTSRVSGPVMEPITFSQVNRITQEPPRDLQKNGPTQDPKAVVHVPETVHIPPVHPQNANVVKDHTTAPLPREVIEDTIAAPCAPNTVHQPLVTNNQDAANREHHLLPTAVSGERSVPYAPQAAHLLSVTNNRDAVAQEHHVPTTALSGGKNVRFEQHIDHQQQPMTASTASDAGNKKMTALGNMLINAADQPIASTAGITNPFVHGASFFAKKDVVAERPAEHQVTSLTTPNASVPLGMPLLNGHSVAVSDNIREVSHIGPGSLHHQDPKLHDVVPDLVAHNGPVQIVHSTNVPVSQQATAPIAYRVTVPDAHASVVPAIQQVSVANGAKAFSLPQVPTVPVTYEATLPHPQQTVSPNLLNGIKPPVEVEQPPKPSALWNGISKPDKTRTSPTRSEVVPANGDRSLTPPGFLKGQSFKLFGGVMADLYTFDGTTSDQKPQMAIVPQSPIRIQDALPGLTLGNFNLVKPRVTYYTKAESTERQAGLWLDSGLALEGTRVGETLKHIFGLAANEIRIESYLGPYQSLAAPFAAPSKLSASSMPPIQRTKIGNVLEFTSAMVKISAVKEQQTYPWSESLRGKALLSVPGTAAPLIVGYVLDRDADKYHLGLRFDDNRDWENAMGVPGLHLSDVVFSASFDKSTKDQFFDLAINAAIKYSPSDFVKVQGRYNERGWEFTAPFDKIDKTMLNKLYARMFRGALHDFKHDLTMTNVRLEASSKNVDLKLVGSATVDSYSMATADVMISPSGFHLNATVSNVTLEQVNLQQAVLAVYIGKQGLVDPDPKKPGITTSFTLAGKVHVRSLALDALVHFDKSPTSNLIWLLHAQETSALRLSQVIPGIPANLDLELKDVSIIATNTDSWTSAIPPVPKNSIKKGFHLMANVTCPEVLAKTIKARPEGMTVQLDLSGAPKDIPFSFPAPPPLRLKDSMVAPSIRAGISLTGSSPAVFVEADLNVTFKNQPNPLVFELRGQANMNEALLNASLVTDWKNPFGISPKLTILSPLSLGVIVDYAAATYPSGLNLQGGILIGETKLSAAFSVGENPNDEMLLVKAEQLGIKDIVSFASMIIEHELPQPRDDLLFFKKLLFTISGGATIGKAYYPPGVTFKSSLLLFGKEALIDCEMVKSPPSLKFRGEIDSFELGPLTVSGYKQPKPSLALEISKTMQHLAVDGRIKLLDVEMDIALRADLMPKLQVFFEGKLNFSDLLKFDVKARCLGDLRTIKDILHEDFSIEADFKQEIIDHIEAMANTHIAAAKKAADEGIEAAQAKLVAAQKAYDNLVKQRQAELDTAKASFEKRSAEVNATVETKKKQILAEEQQKRSSVDAAHKNFDHKIAQLEAELNRTKASAALKIAEAKRGLDEARARGDRAIKDSVTKVAQAENELRSRFGDAENKIRDAENKVKDGQRAVADAQHKVDTCNWNCQHGNVFNKAKNGMELVGFEAELRAEQAGLGTSQGVLQISRSVVSGPAYHLAQESLVAARSSLDVARKAADESLRVAVSSLNTTTTVQSSLIAAAEKSLEEAKKGCNELHVWQAAQAALSEFLKTEASLLSQAEGVLKGLETCGEKVAFDSAKDALALAKAGNKEIGIAHDIMAVTGQSVDEFASFGQWLVKRAGNILNVRRVHISASLNDTAGKGKPFTATVEGTFADAAINIQVDFYPKKGEEFVKALIFELIKEAKKDMRRFVHAI